MNYYLISVFAFYFLLMILLLIGWARNAKVQPANTEEFCFISVVVAARNEEEGISCLLNSLAAMNYPKEYFEVIVIDDHSEDGTVGLIDSFFQTNKMGKLIRLQEERGKKAALAKGIAESKGEIIVTTDADCEVPKNWLLQINHLFSQKNVQMGIGAVKIQPNNFFSSLQSLEFVSVIGTGAATLGLGYPTMCNGANLSFRKIAFEKVRRYEGNEQLASGDDQFLMEKIRNSFPHSVFFLKHEDAVVTTKAVKSIRDFFSQRKRWAGKWHFLSSASQGLAFFVFLFQTSWLIAITWAVIKPSTILFAMIGIKIFLEFLFLKNILRFMSLPFAVISFLTLQFAYAPYVIIVGLQSMYIRNEWKGRDFYSR